VPATPSPTPTKQAPNTPAPRAGGGPEGGRGTDVANVRIEGIEFPYSGYLANIVRQIALRFEPPNRNAPLRAEVSFLIHRDGSVTGQRIVVRSGVYAFDLEAMGSIEAAAAARAFGPLPAGYPDDVLPVVFSFDPSLIR
jgi:protein TonB